MIPWIQVYSNLIKHPKTYALADELKLTSRDASPNAIAAGLVVSLWLWAAQNAPDGDLSKCTPRAVAEAAEYRKKPEAFVDALIKVRFLDADKKLHDWSEHASMLIDSIERSNENNAKRQQRYRERKKRKKEASRNGEVTPDGNVTHNVTHNVTDNGSNAPTVPNQTVPYQSVTTAGTNLDDGKGVTPGEAPAQNCGWMFTRFWEAYPKKIDREAAWGAWKALNPSHSTASAILSALEAWKKSGQWMEDGGRFVPDAANFLTKGYWRATPTPAKETVPKGASGELGAAELEAIQQVLAVQDGDT